MLSVENSIRLMLLLITASQKKVILLIWKRSSLHRRIILLQIISRVTDLMKWNFMTIDLKNLQKNRMISRRKLKTNEKKHIRQLKSLNALQNKKKLIFKTALEKKRTKLKGVTRTLRTNSSDHKRLLEIITNNLTIKTC